MAVTSRGRNWELAHSIWICWVLLTCGFFNWVAFLYIGVRASQKKWIVWGGIYSVPFLLSIVSAAVSDGQGIQPEWLGTLEVLLAMILWLVSVFHAFKVRREYLIRLDSSQRSVAERNADLYSRVRAEYGTDAPVGSHLPRPASSGFETTRSRDVGHNPRTRPSEPIHGSADDAPGNALGNMADGASPRGMPQDSGVDVNNASEQEIAALPGVGLILAKRIVNLRGERGGFDSVENLGMTLGLRPHIVERLRERVSFGAVEQRREQEPPGRTVDF